MLSCVGGGANAEGVVLPPQTDDRIGILKNTVKSRVLELDM